MFKVVSLNLKEFTKLIYGDGGMPKDESIFKRIRFLSYMDFGYSESQLKPVYFVLLKEDYIVGVAKIAYYDLSARHENDYSITFLTIERNFRNKGLARMLVDRVFKYASENNLSIRTSTYTVLGFKRLKKLFNLYSKKYNVDFLDKDDDESLIDTESMYNDDMIHYDEMTDEEKRKWKEKKNEKKMSYMKKFENFRSTKSLLDIEHEIIDAKNEYLKEMEKNTSFRNYALHTRLFNEKLEQLVEDLYDLKNATDDQDLHDRIYDKTKMIENILHGSVDVAVAFELADDSLSNIRENLK